MMKHKNGTLLIIDDIESNRTFLSSLLELEEYNSLEAESGQEGLDLLKKNDINLVLLDYMMPEMNGIETLKIIRKQYSLLDLPVIMVTAKDQTEDIVEALNAGANDYITKPVNVPVAIARINTHYLLNKINRENREREERLRKISEISFEGLVIHDNGIIMDANSIFCTLSGYSINEIIGKNITDLFYPGDFEKINSVPKNYSKYHEINGFKENGIIYPAEIISRDLTYNGRKAKVTAVRDISDKKQSERLYGQLHENNKMVDSILNLAPPLCSGCKNIINNNEYCDKINLFIENNSNSNIIDETCHSFIDKNIENRNFEIDKKSMTAKSMGKNIKLTLIEFEILNYLCDNHERVISIDEFLENVMNYPPGTGNPDAIRTHINRIRSKIEKNHSKPEILINIPRVGYRINL